MLQHDSGIRLVARSIDRYASVLANDILKQVTPSQELTAQPQAAVSTSDVSSSATLASTPLQPPISTTASTSSVTIMSTPRIRIRNSVHFDKTHR